MNNDRISIRQFKPEDMAELKKNAEADNHAGVFYPTHVSIKDGKIVGYLSIGVVPMVLTWQSTKEVKPLDSVKLVSFIEGVLTNFQTFAVPCDPASPYNKLLPKLGYVEYTKPVKLYIKVQV